MEKATRFINVLAAIFIMLTGAYIHLSFDRLLSFELLVLVWVLVTVVVALQLSSAISFVRRNYS